MVEATLEATFSSPAAAAVCLVESLKLARLLPAEKSIEDSGLTEL